MILDFVIYHKFYLEMNLWPFKTHYGVSGGGKNVFIQHTTLNPIIIFKNIDM